MDGQFVREMENVRKKKKQKKGFLKELVRVRQQGLSTVQVEGRNESNPTLPDDPEALSQHTMQGEGAAGDSPNKLGLSLVQGNQSSI